MGKVLITDTILRDAHQSQAATRMRLEEMLPVADKLDKIGYYSLECWGGATFDSCMRFLNEDPWERLRALRKRIASEQGIAPYMVFSDATLRDMCARLPQTEDEFLEVNGVGQTKLLRYGEAFLAEIAAFENR